MDFVPTPTGDLPLDPTGDGDFRPLDPLQVRPLDCFISPDLGLLE